MRNEWKTLAPVPLRLVLGFGFVYHGFPKLFTSTGFQEFAGMLEGIGMPMPGVTAWAVSLLEVFGGLALIAGAFTVTVASLGVVEMIVALLAVHLPHGFNFVNIVGTTDSGAPVFGMPGYEVNLLYIAGFLTLILGGAGRYSIDALRRPTTARRRAVAREPIAVPDAREAVWPVAAGNGSRHREHAGVSSSRDR